MSKTNRSQYANEEKKLERKIRKNQSKKRSGTKGQIVSQMLQKEQDDYDD